MSSIAVFLFAYWFQIWITGLILTWAYISCEECLSDLGTFRIVLSILWPLFWFVVLICLFTEWMRPPKWPTSSVEDSVIDE